MTRKPDDFLTQAWKRQCDAGLSAIEAIVEGATKMHGIQLQAAATAHADLEATRKAASAATDASQILKLQADWLRSSTQKSMAYWSALAQAVGETDAALVKCACSQAPLALPGMVKPAEKASL